MEENDVWIDTAEIAEFLYNELIKLKYAPTTDEVFDLADIFIDFLISKQALTEEDVPQFNEPEHYHKHNIDTIMFLQEGFPKEVFMGFALGHIIKYAQRANYKNGREDYVKMVDYAKRALDWYDKTHS